MHPPPPSPLSRRVHLHSRPRGSRRLPPPGRGRPASHGDAHDHPSQCASMEGGPLQPSGHSFAAYIINGMSDGLRVGFARPHPLCSAMHNCPSADAHPQVVTSYIEREVSLGRFLSPFSHTNAPPRTHLSKFAVILKGHTPGRWRLITDLSSPKGQSVNDGIAPPICSLRYVTVDEIATAAAGLGRGALIAKLDVESAYCIVPVHPDDRPLLGVQWQGTIYVDAMLPFGLRSAPKIFTAIADALEWVLRRRGVRYV